MIGNILAYIVLIAVLVFFAWLTLRAWRIKALWLRILAGLLAGLLTLVVAVVVFFAGKGLMVGYASAPEARDLTVAGTPEQIARGQYLADISCVGCHSSADTPGEFPLSGGGDFAAEIPMPIGSIIVANLTPAGVLAERTDGELFRSIRTGIGPHGRLAMMSFLPYGQLSDADIEALIAFLRSQEPVDTGIAGGDNLNLLGLIMFYGVGVLPFPMAEATDSVVTAPPAGPTVEYGKYVATLGECRGCHGPDMTGTPPSMMIPEGFPNPRPLVETLSQAEFIEMMRTGIRPDGTPLGEDMPWQNAAKMTDGDLEALYVYLSAAP